MKKENGQTNRKNEVSKRSTLEQCYQEAFRGFSTISERERSYSEFQKRGEYSQQFEAFVAVVEKRKLIRDFAFLSKPCDDSGQEHEVWYNSKSNRFWKSTYPNCFGLSVGKEEACVLDYLNRLILSNKIFQDDVELEGVAVEHGEIRIVTSQMAIRGRSASPVAIDNFFADIGFTKKKHFGSTFYYRYEDNILVCDAHSGNVLETAEGFLVPIDINIIIPDEELKDKLNLNPKN